MQSRVSGVCTYPGNISGRANHRLVAASVAPRAADYSLDQTAIAYKFVAKLAFFCDAIIRFGLTADAIFELAIPLGKQQGHDIQTLAAW